MDRMADELKRRDFLRAAVTAVAAGAVAPAHLLAMEPDPEARAELASALAHQAQEGPPPVPLGNGEHPALVFQAYPGGTGSLYKRWNSEGLDPFRRHPIHIDPWVGPVPGDPDDIAFLPVHRLAALIRGGHVSSVELTEIYLERTKRFDESLMFAVTILEDRAMEEARQADIDLAVAAAVQFVDVRLDQLAVDSTCLGQLLALLDELAGDVESEAARRAEVLQRKQVQPLVAAGLKRRFSFDAEQPCVVVGLLHPGGFVPGDLAGLGELLSCRVVHPPDASHCYP